VRYGPNSPPADGGADPVRVDRGVDGALWAGAVLSDAAGAVSLDAIGATGSDALEPVPGSNSGPFAAGCGSGDGCCAAGAAGCDAKTVAAGVTGSVVDG